MSSRQESEPVKASLATVFALVRRFHFPTPTWSGVPPANWPLHRFCPRPGRFRRTGFFWSRRHLEDRVLVQFRRHLLGLGGVGSPGYVQLRFRGPAHRGQGRRPPTAPHVGDGDGDAGDRPRHWPLHRPGDGRLALRTPRGLIPTLPRTDHRFLFPNVVGLVSPLRRN